MARFFLTTPIYYVNDAPHIGHAYTTVVADGLARWHRLLGDDVFFLTGTDEHGLKVAQAAEANGVTPKERADATSVRFVEAWRQLDIAYDDFIRTTEPRHHVAVQRFLQAVNDNGHIELGTYEGLYCVRCEAYYTEAELVDGKCPIHGTPVELVKEENYFFKLSTFQQALLDWYEANPHAVQPESKRNEALGFIRQGLQDISITRTSLKWGVPVPWDDRHVFYVWYDALINYVTAIGYGEDPDRFTYWWPAVHHLIGKEIIRFHCVWWPAMCMAAGIDPPAHLFVHGWLLVGGEKMSKTSLNQIAPTELVADFGVDAVRYHLLRDTPLGPDGEFSYEGMVARYNADLANNLGNLASRASPRWWPASAAASVRRRAPTHGSLPWPPRSSRPPRTRGSASRHTRPSRRRGGSSARPTPPSRPRSRGNATPAQVWTRCWATPSSRCESSPCWPGRPCPAPARSCGDASGSQDRLATNACPRRRRGAAIPPVGRWSGPRPSFPGGSPEPSTVWTDSHCHLQGAVDPDGALERARAAGVTRVVCIGTDADQSRQALALARDGVWATVGLHPHDAKEGVDGVAALLEEVAGAEQSALVAVGECGLDYHYDHSPRATQRDAFAAQVGLAHRYGLALVVHTREAWDDTLAILGPRACRSARCSTASPGARPRRAGASISAASCPSAGS